jgi:ribosome-binding factor A
MRQTPRSHRLNEAVQEAIAFIIEEDVSDPRLRFVTVTGAEVSRDLSVARVYITAHGDEERYAEVLAGLESAKGRIRSLLARRVPMRQTPELRFELDTSVDAGMRMREALELVPPTLAARREAGEDEAVDDDADEHGDAAAHLADAAPEKGSPA